jgi:AcrR family transcriptional regulator
MSKTMLKPGPDLMQRVHQTFLDYGYSGLSMVTMAKACGFTQRALYYYFNNKEAAFRAVIRWWLVRLTWSSSMPRPSGGAGIS